MLKKTDNLNLEVTQVSTEAIFAILDNPFFSKQKAFYIDTTARKFK